MKRGGSESGFHFISDYLRCPQHFYWKFVRGLEPKERPQALLFGTAIHEGLADWFRHFDLGWKDRAQLMRETFEKECEILEMPIEEVNRGRALLEAYAFDKIRESWKVHAVEVPLSHSLGSSPYVFTGRVDAVVESEGRVYIMDHKTTGWILGSLIRTLMVSDQATGYLWLWGQEHPELQPVGVIFNILKSSRGSTEFKQALVTKTDEDINKFVLDTEDILDEIIRKFQIPNSRWPKNTNACFLYNRQCPYLDLCMGTNYEGLIGTQFVVVEDESGNSLEHQDVG